MPTTSDSIQALYLDKGAFYCQSDAELISMYLDSGNRAALEPIVVRYSALVYGVVSKVVYRPHDREDAYQATFLALVRSASRIRNAKSIASWLGSAAFRIALRMRQNQRIVPGTLTLEELVQVVEPSPDPVSQIAQDIEFEKLNIELQKLPSGLRDALIEHYFLGLSAPAIAERMELSVSAIEGRLRRGKQKLRAALARKGISLSVVVGTLSGWSATSSAASDKLLALGFASIRYTVPVATPTSVIANGGGAVKDGSSEHEINARVLSLVEGEMNMSTISISKVAYGAGIGLCALLATSIASSIFFSESPQGGVGAFALATSPSASPADEDDKVAAAKVDSTANKKESQSSDVSNNPFGTDDDPFANESANPPRKQIPPQQKWLQRGSVAKSRIENARIELESTELELKSIQNGNDLCVKIAELTGLPVVVSAGVDADINPLKIDLKRFHFGSGTKILAVDLLENLLTNSNLGYVIRSNRIEIVPIEESNTTRMYDVSIILVHRLDEEKKNLMQLLSNFVLRGRDLNDDVKMSVAGETLIVWCDEPTHRRVEEFLSQLSQIKEGIAETTSSNTEPTPAPATPGMM